MSTATVDFANMTAAQIKEFIETQGAPPVEAAIDPAVADQPRDENGRFIATAEPVVDPAQDPAPEEFVEEKELDLGDGSGVQVFRGVGASREEALSALADELVTAQINATRKIRELSTRPAPVTSTTPVVEINPDEELRLSQQLLSNPTAAMSEMLKAQFGMDPSEIKAKLERADAAERARQQEEIRVGFVQATPDYFANESNGKRMLRWLQIENLPETAETLQKAFTSLSAEGLLQKKPEVTTTTNRPRSSGISTRSTTPAPVRTTEAELDAFKKLTSEQMREKLGYLPYKF